MNENAKRIVQTLKEWYCPDKIKNEEYVGDEYLNNFIADVYNEAMNDVESFIDIMIENNPQYDIALTALKNTMFPGSKLDENTK